LEAGSTAVAAVIRPPLPELMLGFGQVVLLFNLFCRSEQAQLL
jgi:hypothetical protein